MKIPALLCLSFLFLSIPSFSQTINDIPISDIDVQYIQIIGTTRLLSDKVNVELDFGQNTTFFGSNKVKKIINKEGKVLKFNSMIDALNFMSENGYEFVQAYAFAEEDQNVYHYIMKKSN